MTAVIRYTMKDIHGNTIPLAHYDGKVILIVNVASECGLTPQYKALQALHERFAGQGLVILAFPSNDFGAQEPGSNEEIATFCETHYGVEFELFSKVSVKGPDKCDLYEFLTDEARNPSYAGEITWNFEKFILSRDGRVVGRFDPRVTPDDPALISLIETELAKHPVERLYDGD